MEIQGRPLDSATAVAVPDGEYVDVDHSEWRFPGKAFALVWLRARMSALDGAIHLAAATSADPALSPPTRAAPTRPPGPPPARFLATSARMALQRCPASDWRI